MYRRGGTYVMGAAGYNEAVAIRRPQLIESTNFVK